MNSANQNLPGKSKAPTAFAPAPWLAKYPEEIRSEIARLSLGKKRVTLPDGANLDNTLLGRLAKRNAAVLQEPYFRREEVTVVVDDRGNYNMDNTVCSGKTGNFIHALLQVDTGQLTSVEFFHRYPLAKDQAQLKGASEPGVERGG